MQQHCGLLRRTYSETVNRTREHAPAMPGCAGNMVNDTAACCELHFAIRAQAAWAAKTYW